jgi:uncharacterized membrane protein YfcA
VAFLVLFVAVGLGAVVQGSVGFGFALVVVPALTLIRPEVLPATVLLLTLPMALTMAVRERHAMNISGLAYLLFGRVVGSLEAWGYSCWCQIAIFPCCSGASSWWP